ncbi:ubiquitin carboxyl-terminal hydrolase-like isoform X1 [Saccostrea echinata]|uniref:ubiquitin carboxyl-terminal hydrolase-like isoform X1 n=1 Tax=Saccostrea echinata TaxID=191078 RepID=UPI002A801F6C|nr:ubiquitin carboxyl-terminal hydrolase-like isoform X1 [Saccostrea echinata]
MADQISWIPLESNPDVLNKYIHNLGVPKEWQFVDVYGLEPDLLGMVPKPVAAVVLLYPITDKSEATTIGEQKQNPDLYFVKQTIRNACGTVAIVHALANNQDKIKFLDDKHFAQFLKKTLSMSAEERAEFLQVDQDMGSAHEDTAQEGQTKAPPSEAKVNTHFVSFVCKDGGLYQLNGRDDAPIYHGPCTPDSLLEKTAKVAKQFMERDPDELNFTLMALSKVE